MREIMSERCVLCGELPKARGKGRGLREKTRVKTREKKAFVTLCR